jgi:hypothetical protein
VAVCDLAKHPKACSVAQSRYPRPECAGCEAGKKNDAITAERLAKEAPPVPRETIRAERETIQPKKEEVGGVDQEKMREGILRVLGRKGMMTISNLKLFTAREESKEDFRAAVDALAREGKVVTKDGVRAGTLSLWLPGTAAPPEGKKKEPPSEKKAPSAVKYQRNIKKRQIDSSTATASPPPGNGGFQNRTVKSLVADLMIQRQKIDNAIAALRELG